MGRKRWMTRHGLDLTIWNRGEFRDANQRATQMGNDEKLTFRVRMNIMDV